MIAFLQKNILFFQDSVLPSSGGVPRVSDTISKELEKRNYKCYFIFYDKDNKEYPDQIKLKVDIKQRYENFETSILKFIKEKQINYFVCQNAYLSIFRKIYKRIRILYPLCPFLCFLHASPDYWQLSYRLATDRSKHNLFLNTLKKTLKKVIFPLYNPYITETTSLYNICDKFILLSDSFEKSFIKIYSINNVNNKLHIIPNPSTFNDYLSVNDIIKKENWLLIVSRLDESQKKISLSLRIWKQVQQQLRNNWKLYIIGTGPNEGFYKSYVDNNNIANVIFLGQQSNLLEYYQQASIFMMTSIWEGLPMTLLEALQNGVVPIVFDNFSALHDVLKDGENGYIVQNNNMRKFSEILLNLIKNENLRNQLSSNAIESSKQYHVSRIADLWEKLFNT